MINLLKSHHPLRHARSFKFAFQGIFHALLNEANFRVQVVIVIIATVFGIHFKISNIEWALLIITMGSLLSAEMINTAIEEFIDALIKEYHDGAKVIKDVSAGFVLITAIIALLVLILIFGHRFIL
jgi:undecaprenol kinase